MTELPRILLPQCRFTNTTAARYQPLDFLQDYRLRHRPTYGRDNRRLADETPAPASARKLPERERCNRSAAFRA